MWLLPLLATLLWTACTAKQLWNAPAYDLSALVVGAKVLDDGLDYHLYDHNPIYYNLADSPEFKERAAKLEFTGFAPTPFLHPPLVAAVARPLASRSFRAVARVWLLVSLVATVAGLALAFWLYAPEWATPGRLTIAFVALAAYEPVRYGLWLGQTTPLVFAAVLASLALLRLRRELVAGLVLAFPVFLKLTPAIFGAIWIWQRRGRALFGLLGGLAGLSVLSVVTTGLRLNIAYARRVAELAGITLVSFNNHSLPAFVTRLSLHHPDVASFRILSPPLWVTLATGVATAILVSYSLHATQGRARAAGPWLEALGMLAVLLVPGISWTHYFVFLVPVALVGCASAGSVPTTRRWLGLSSLGAIALCMRPILTNQTDFAPTHAGLIASPTLAALGLLPALLLIGPTRGE